MLRVLLVASILKASGSVAAGMRYTSGVKAVLKPAHARQLRHVATNACNALAALAVTRNSAARKHNMVCCWPDAKVIVAPTSEGGA
jgi:hypothetical protein